MNCVSISLISTLALIGPAAGLAAAPDFTKDIRPILAKRCMNCHGPDAAKRKGDLRLDTKEGLLHPDVVTPGKAAESELIKRLLTKDEDEVMPPPGKGDPVTPDERAKLEAWINAGASYQEHWAFNAPVKPAVPVAAGARNEMDAFVFDTLARQGMAPAAEASREVWLRRVSFDLTGLPPTLEEQDAFWRTPPRWPMSTWWTACCNPRPTASGWATSGWTWRATPTRMAATRTRTASPGRIASG